MKIIFLDIDGVLNGHEFCEAARSCKINPVCVAHLNRVLAETGAMVVLSSAWRYMILGGSVTLRGFEYMLRTHGVACEGRLIGRTCSDETEGMGTRGKQIRGWLMMQQMHADVESFAVVDDEDFDIAGEGLPLVRTDGFVGMTAGDAERLIELLNAKGPR